MSDAIRSCWHARIIVLLRVYECPIPFFLLYRAHAFIALRSNLERGNKCIPTLVSYTQTGIANVAMFPLHAYNIQIYASWRIATHRDICSRVLLGSDRTKKGVIDFFHIVLRRRILPSLIFPSIFFLFFYRLERGVEISVPIYCLCMRHLQTAFRLIMLARLFFSLYKMFHKFQSSIPNMM